MIVDKQGRRIRPEEKTATASAVVFVSEDGEKWLPVKPYNVPDWVKRADVMGDMLNGMIVGMDDDGPFYRAGKLESIH